MKVFIFDMGGVVVHNVSIIPEMAKALGISPDDFYRFAGSDPHATHTHPYHTGDLAEFMKGTITTKQFWDKFSKRSGLTVKEDLWYTHFKPDLDTNTVQVIRDLKKAGYRVVCGTNTLEAHYRYHLEHDEYEPFDKVYASDAMGIIKPDPEFWKYIIKEEQVKPEEAFFTDDYKENTDAAQKLGLRVHQFINAEGLRAALKEYL